MSFKLYKSKEISKNYEKYTKIYQLAHCDQFATVKIKKQCYFDVNARVVALNALKVIKLNPVQVLNANLICFTKKSNN